MSPPPRALARLTCAVVMIAMSGSAGAATLRHVPLQDLASHADAVVLGTIVEESTGWNEAHDIIVTRYVLDATDDLSGGARTGPVTITRVGGEADGLALVYDGMARLAVGERVAVFLLGPAEGPFIIAAMNQGVLRGPGDALVREVPEGTAGAARREVWTVDELRNLCRARPSRP